MAVYTIHMRGDGPDAARAAVFVLEGFSKSAFVFGPFWFLRHRLWLAALAWIFALLLLGLASSVLSVLATFWLAVLFAALTGLEANALRRRALVRRGYPIADIATGAGRDTAERQFFARFDDESLPPPSRPSATTGRPAGSSPVLGLFPEAEGRR